MLDSLTRWDLQDVLVEVWTATHVTAIMVTHDVDEAILLADRVVMMTNGPEATIGKHRRGRPAAPARPQGAARARRLLPLPRRGPRVPRGIRARRRTRRRTSPDGRAVLDGPPPFILATEVWVPGPSGDVLLRADGLYGPLKPFDGPAPSHGFARGEGLPGRAWKEARPILLTDLADPAFLRADAGGAGRPRRRHRRPGLLRRQCSRASSSSSAARTTPTSAPSRSGAATSASA